MSVANFAHEMKNQFKAMNTTKFDTTVIPVATDFNGNIVVGMTLITAVAILTALSDVKFAHNAVVHCIASDASTTVAMVYNSGTPDAPSFASISAIN